MKIPSYQFDNISSSDLLNLGNFSGVFIIANNNWMEEIQTESRSINILKALALFAAFYGLLMGIYVCLFGFSAVTPWGICQRTCCRRRSKEKLYRRFAPDDIPLISQSRIHKTIPERLDVVENFIKLFILNVDDYADPVPETTVPETKPPSSRFTYIGGGPINDEKPRRRAHPVSFISSLYSTSSSNTLVGAPPDSYQTITNVKPSETMTISTPNNPPLNPIEEEITSEPPQTTINQNDSNSSSSSFIGAPPDSYQTINNVKPSGNMTISSPIIKETTSKSPQIIINRESKQSDSNISSSHGITNIHVDQDNNELDPIEFDRHSNISTERKTIYIDQEMIDYVDDDGKRVDIDQSTYPDALLVLIQDGKHVEHEGQLGNITEVETEVETEVVETEIIETEIVETEIVETKVIETEIEEQVE
ncbi:12334_t:CDS:2 [Dentiscutata erythropus]|uniref:12334_t:CDS:1 n=1 Tax=Dentiscutata erythropus TaxID=1348616 RepID=A0A9N9GT53_9GLOM|nr:12334_t:CDS:2 [Dentiscutata erythropus]